MHFFSWPFSPEENYFSVCFTFTRKKSIFSSYTANLVEIPLQTYFKVIFKEENLWPYKGIYDSRLEEEKIVGKIIAANSIKRGIIDSSFSFL